MQTASSGINVSNVVHNIMKKNVLHINGDVQETPMDMFIRVAKHISVGHAKYEPNDIVSFMDKAVDMMFSQIFMPNTPTLVNAGFDRAQLSACFVLPVDDTLESIYLAHLHQGLIQASGGGTGFYLGDIRSKDTMAAGRLKTRGPLNWLRMLNENAVHVAQGMRDGANMAILNVGHPDILDFITCKSVGYKTSIDDIVDKFGVSSEEAKRIKAIIGVEKFNLSVSIRDKFMEALDKNDDWYFKDPHTKERKGTVKAQELWDLIVHNAHEHGEPGLFFVDTANRFNTIPHIGMKKATNPCGEQDLLPYESCNLGHLNLSKFVIGTNGTSQFNWKAFEDAIRFGMRFLDDVVEVNYFPIPQLKEMNLGSRRVGLGLMGWADTLALMNIPYDSSEAILKAEEIGKFFDGISLDESRKMGKERGNFGYFEGSVFEKTEKYMRNSNRTTIAPTGSTSMYAMCSSSIEPLFSPITIREQSGMVQIDYHPALFTILKNRGLDTPSMRDKLKTCGGSVRDATFLPEDIRMAFPTAHDVDLEWHIKHQIAWQKNITSAVSKTINLKHDATINDVDRAYRMAYEGGCKGITVYRDGSRMNQPLSTSKKDNKQVLIGKRAPVTIGSNRKIPNGCGNLMVYIGGSDDNVHEITARLGKAGGCASAQTEAIARMASIAMQYGAPPEKISKQLCGIRCHLTAMYKSKHTGNRPRIVTSCGDAISIALNEHIADMNNSSVDVVEQNLENHVGACPECGAAMAFEEGCSKCYSCGFSRC